MNTTRLFLLLFASITFYACEKDIDIDVPAGKQWLVVEGYINNVNRFYNYVVLSNSVDYFNPNLQGLPVSNATVTITEGEWRNNQYVWDRNTTVQLRELNFPGIPNNFRSGVYFDPRLITDSSNALIGRPQKDYLLEIAFAGKTYSAITRLLPPVTLDSLTFADSTYDDDDARYEMRMTSNYKEPDTIGNRYLYFWQWRENRTNFGWGGLTFSRAPGRDDLVNGQYIKLTHPQGLPVGDTIQYMLTSVTRETYNFWDSYQKARDNNGLFQTPVNLISTIQGPDVIGCFSGFSISTRTQIVKK